MEHQNVLKNHQVGEDIGETASQLLEYLCGMDE